jgi:hypothetical protein
VPLRHHKMLSVVDRPYHALIHSTLIARGNENGREREGGGLGRRGRSRGRRLAPTAIAAAIAS